MPKRFYFGKDTKINIVDTPGHADFGSEVEQVLRSIDDVILVVDAQEGPMPQTRFVLKKSLELGLRPIVVLNKIDKPAARPEEVSEMVYELFLDLGATDEQPIFRLSTRSVGMVAMHQLGDERKNLEPLLDTILKNVPPACDMERNAEGTFLAQPFNLGYDNFVGRLAVARMYSGVLGSTTRSASRTIRVNASRGVGQVVFFPWHGACRNDTGRGRRYRDDRRIADGRDRGYIIGCSRSGESASYRYR